jgi:hypothetical protein
MDVARKSCVPGDIGSIVLQGVNNELLSSILNIKAEYTGRGKGIPKTGFLMAGPSL